MPTRRGNILKNAELYPKDRYRIDAVLIWPRLYYLLPERFIQTFAEARGALDFMLVISSLSGAFALISAGYLLYVRGPMQLFFICNPGGLFIAWLAYKGAIDGALIYAQQIKVAFDLYRNDLLKQMNMPLPATPAEEKERCNEVVLFLYRNVPGLLTYRMKLRVSRSFMRKYTLRKLISPNLCSACTHQSHGQCKSMQPEP
jgi:hypothetical protein